MLHAMRMEAEVRSMKPIPRTPTAVLFEGLSAAVQAIRDHGMPHISQVAPDLVLTSSDDTQLHERQSARHIAFTSNLFIL